MKGQAISHVLLHWAERITRPASHLGEEEKTQARILAALALVLWGATLLIAPVWLYSASDFAPAIYLAPALLVVFAAIYRVSRTRFYIDGALALAFSFGVVEIAILLGGAAPVTERMLVLPFLLIPVILAALFLSYRVALLLTAGGAVVIGAYFFVPAAPFAYTFANLVFFLVTAALTGLSGLLSRRERRRVQAEHATLERFFSVTLDLLCIANTQGHFLKVNKAWEAVLGYPVADLNGARFLDFVHPDDLPATLENVQRLADNHIVVNFTNRYRHRDGSYRFIEWRANPFGELIYAAARDITHRMHTEQTLRESEARQRALLDAIPDLVFRLNRQGVFLDYHAPALNQLLLPPTDFIGRPHTEIMPPEVAAKYEAHAAQVFATGQEAVYEYSLPVAEGYHDYESRVVKAGEDEIIAIVRDVTDRNVHRQREFELALEKERSNVLLAFIRNAAHEFRTPLTAISVNSFLLTRLEEPARRRASADVIQKQVEGVTRLVDMLLAMAALEMHEPLATAPINIGALVEEVCEEARAKNPTGANLTFHLPPAGTPTVMGRHDDLAEALRQILDNAFHFTPAQGTINVSTSVQPARLAITVRDSGAGIAAADLPHIFKTFWRHDTAHSTPGFGLGLAIAQRIAQLHDGHIEVASEAGQGATFSLWLPLATAAGNNKRRTAPHPRI